MLISLFKLTDIGPSLTNMVTNENIYLEKEVIEKFEFSGAMTYSLIFQGTIDLGEIASELYGPFPFAFSNGFVQYAFSFIADDPSMKDERMQKKTIGLLLCLIPEIVSKIDDFREEFEKMLVYRFHGIKFIEQVDDTLLKEIVEDYNQIVTDLLNDTQANLLFQQLKQLVDKDISQEQEVKRILLIYPKKELEKIRNSFANLLLSLPYTKVCYNEKEAFIQTRSFILNFVKYDTINKKLLNDQDTMLFMFDVMKNNYQVVYDIVKRLETRPKIGVIVSQCSNLENMSKKYGDFFIGLQEYIGDVAFFSSSYYTTKEFKAKLLEALFWALMP
ncbi:MAG: hypothetical protein ACTSQE_05255 [Candidatus Heimdallarchaeaceae archaeon]